MLPSPILAIGGSVEARIIAQITIARVAAFDGDLQVAQPAAEAALALAQELGDEWLAVWALNTLATVQFHEGGESEIIAKMLESGTRMGTTGDRRNLFMLGGRNRATRPGSDDLAGVRPSGARARRFDDARETGTATAALLALEGDERGAFRLYRRSSEQLGALSAFYSLVPFRRDVLEPLSERFENGERTAVEHLLRGDSLAGEIIAALGPDGRLETRSLRRS